MEQLILILDKLKDIEIKSNPTPFNMLNIAYQDISGKERLHSKLFAGLLNPKENHGLNSLCFETFLKQIDVNFDNRFIDSVCVETERNINGRFIDIIIVWKDNDNKKHAIIIENKLNDAPDLKDQLNDYFKGISDEGYIVEKIIYMPYNKSYKSFENTDSTEEVKNKCKDFDSEDIVKWLEVTISKAPQEKASILIQYKEFFECLINKNFIYMKAAQDILAQVSSNEDIAKLENLIDVINSKEWVQAFFNPITVKLQNHFGENLIVDYIPKSKKHSDDCCAYYAQYWFEPYKYWLELGKHKDTSIGVYLCSAPSNDLKIEFAKEMYEASEEDTYLYSKLFYSNVNKDKQFFHYAPKNETEIQKLLEVIIPILEELSKYKEV